jgi:phosphoglycolate phosphatase
MNFKGVIFDLDGTLVNSLEDLADSMNAILQNHSFPAHSLSAYKDFIGNGIRYLVGKSLPESNRDEATIDRCHKLMVEVYRENAVNKTRPYDGISELLEELVSRNMKMAVFSNKADEFTKYIVHALLPEWNFEAILGLSVDAHKKPNPFVALQISEKFGVSPNEIIYLGDSGVDMQTATNAGMYAVGALWGFRTEAELTSNGARHLIKKPSDLLKIL